MRGHADGVRRKVMSLQEGLAKRKKKNKKTFAPIQKNAGSYQGSAECRKLSGISRMMEGQGSAECRKLSLNKNKIHISIDTIGEENLVKVLAIFSVAPRPYSFIHKHSFISSTLIYLRVYSL